MATEVAEQCEQFGGLIIGLLPPKGCLLCRVEYWIHTVNH